ncbi:MAG: GAF domain-containing protein [Gammaproteobacteria bacterium]|nr:GAF domain-containing protein [Gammaproteobacteria bacterium]
MKTFIKVIEIWTPTQDRKSLTLADSYYGDYAEFYQHSQNIIFSYDEGLPGTAWTQSTPLVITDLDHSCFVRKEAAKNAGINCAIALPVFAGQFLLSVIVLLCGDEEKLAGAIEVWEKNPDKRNELRLLDGYYGSLEKFEWVSRRICFPKGSGLPGTVWDYRIPQIVADMSSSETFLRASNAQLEGITTAFGIPFLYDAEREYVLTLLSARGTPIARRFEIWLPDREHHFVSLYTGHSEIPHDVFTYQEIEKGQGLVGQVWLTGCPAISHDPANDSFLGQNAITDALKASVAIPVIEDGALKAIVAFTL